MDFDGACRDNFAYHAGVQREDAREIFGEVGFVIDGRKTCNTRLIVLQPKLHIGDLSQFRHLGDGFSRNVFGRGEGVKVGATTAKLGDQLRTQHILESLIKNAPLVTLRGLRERGIYEGWKAR